MNEAGARRRNHWVNHIARHAHAKPGAAYLRLEGRTVPWAQIHERVAVIAAALRERGVRAGDRVAIMMTNRPEFLETMFAANAVRLRSAPIAQAGQDPAPQVGLRQRGLVVPPGKDDACSWLAWCSREKRHPVAVRLTEFWWLGRSVPARS